MIFQKVKNKFILIPIIYLFFNQCRQLFKSWFQLSATLSLLLLFFFLFFRSLLFVVVVLFFAVFVVVCCGLLLFVVV